MCGVGDGYGVGMSGGCGRVWLWGLRQDGWDEVVCEGMLFGLGEGGLVLVCG